MHGIEQGAPHEYHCTIGNDLQDMERRTPHGMPLYDMEWLAGHGADRTTWNATARQETNCRTRDGAHLTECPCTIGNELQDMTRVAAHGIPLHDRKWLARYGVGHVTRNVPAQQETDCKTRSGSHRTERPCMIGNGLQDNEQVTPREKPPHDTEQLAGRGAGHTAWNAPAR